MFVCVVGFDWLVLCMDVVYVGCIVGVYDCECVVGCDVVCECGICYDGVLFGECKYMIDCELEQVVIVMCVLCDCCVGQVLFQCGDVWIVGYCCVCFEDWYVGQC